MNVDIVVPVHNQAGALERNIPLLYGHLKNRFPYRWKVVVVDHGSNDGTFWAARKLEERYSGVAALQVALAGRGRAVKRGSQGLGDIFCYIDVVSLPSDLDDITGLARLVADDRCDVAAGYWAAGGAWEGRFVSGLYRLGLRVALNLPVADAQCPFKAVSRRVTQEILPQVNDESWFFDTELLVRAQAGGCRIQQAPVSCERPHGSALEEPLPDVMRRVLDLRRRVRVAPAGAAGRRAAR